MFGGRNFPPVSYYYSMDRTGLSSAMILTKTGGYFPAGVGLQHPVRYLGSIVVIRWQPGIDIGRFEEMSTILIMKSALVFSNSYDKIVMEALYGGVGG